MLRLATGIIRTDNTRGDIITYRANPHFKLAVEVDLSLLMEEEGMRK